MNEAHKTPAIVAAVLGAIGGCTGHPVPGAIVATVLAVTLLLLADRFGSKAGQNDKAA